MRQAKRIQASALVWSRREFRDREGTGDAFAHGKAHPLLLEFSRHYRDDGRTGARNTVNGRPMFAITGDHRRRRRRVAYTGPVVGIVNNAGDGPMRAPLRGGG